MDVIINLALNYSVLKNELFLKRHSPLTQVTRR